MTMTVRLGAGTRRAIDALARRRGQSRSDVVREALEHYAAAHGAGAGSEPFDAWADVIGIVQLAAPPSTRSTLTTGERFTAMVRDKARARRPR